MRRMTKNDWARFALYTCVPYAFGLLFVFFNWGGLHEPISSGFIFGCIALFMPASITVLFANQIHALTLGRFKIQDVLLVTLMGYLSTRLPWDVYLDGGRLMDIGGFLGLIGAVATFLITYYIARVDAEKREEENGSGV